MDKYVKSKKGLLYRIYADQRHRSIKKNMPAPDYTLRNLRDKYLDDKKFNELYINWVQGGYKKKFSPSLDRINSKLPYTFDNLQWMTWQENFDKGAVERSKAVIQYDLDGYFIKEYISIRQAARHLNISHAQISLCCTGKLEKSSGFTWKFNRKQQ